MGPEVDPLIGGRVLAPEGERLEGYTIEFINETAKEPWRSGKVPLEAEGTFTTELWAEEGQENVYRIELCDTMGALQDTSPDRLSYRVVNVGITAPPLIHSVGVALANNEVEWFFKKGATLPVCRRHILRTAVDIKRGQDTAIIRIPIVEGEYSKANRNSLIGHLEVGHGKITRDVPIGSEVEVRIEIDKDRIIHSEAYVPIIDAHQEKVLELKLERADRNDLQAALDRQKRRLAEAREQAASLKSGSAIEIIEEIDRQNMVHEVEVSLSAAEDARDALDKAQSRLHELQAKLDELEQTLHRPSLVAEAEEQIDVTGRIVDDFGDTPARQQYEDLKRKIRQAIENGDDDALRIGIDDMRSLGASILVQQPEFWIAYLGSLEKKKADMRDQSLANDLFARARRAILANDLDALQAAVRQLNSLLPTDAQISEEDVFGSTVIR